MTVIRILCYLPIVGYCCGCSTGFAPPEPLTFRGQTMGTSYTVRLSALPPTASATDVHAEIGTLLNRVDSLMSTYRDESEVTRFNRFQQDTWVDVSVETAMVSGEALAISKLTGGAFDPTVGRLVTLWGFGPQSLGAIELPAGEHIQERLASSGSELFEVRQCPPSLRKKVPDLQIDLSAIAKGFAVDLIAEMLTELGAEGYMIEVGGETRTHGNKPDGSPWIIGIEAPHDHGRSLWRTLALRDASLATSGDYRNFRRIGGKRYAHTIDPQTGRPVTHALASASVVAKSCMQADALATALMVMGPDNAYEFAVEHELAVLLIIRDEDRFQQRITPAFASLVPGEVSER